MKKIILSILIILIGISAFSQRRGSTQWIGISGIGEYGNSILFNYALEHDDRLTQYYFNNSYGYGGKLGISLNNDFEIGIEGLHRSFMQRYHVRPEQGGTYIKRVLFKATDIGLSLKYTSFNGVYYELGARFTSLKDSVDNYNSAPYKERIQNDSIFNSSVKSIVAGVGFILYSSMNDRVRVYFGLRASYSFDDLMKDPAKPIIMDEIYRPYYDRTYKTQLFTISAKLEIVYYFAYHGKAGCGQSRWVFFK